MDESNSIQNYCRICAKNPPDVRNIFEVFYKEKLLSDILGQCLQCTVVRAEYLPEYICSQCCADLIKMYKFIETYEKSEKWFISRHNAINEAKMIKIETECPMELEQNPEISVESEHQMFVESVVDAVSDQDPPLNPLELKEEYDCNYEFDGTELAASPIGSKLEIQELNEPNSLKPDNTAAAYRNSINKETASKVSQQQQIIRYNKETNKFVCSLCSKQFSSRVYSKIHENFHTGKLVYNCFICDQKFLRWGYRLNHIRNVHPEVVYECYVCKLRLKSIKQLNQHIEEHYIEESTLVSDASCDDNHTVEKKFKCPHQDCQKAFTRKSILQYHLKIHEGKIEDICHCGKGFVNASQLRRHQATHLNNREQQKKKFFCELCPDVSFDSKRTWYHHMDRHSGKMYKCKYCEMKLTTREGRLSHQRNIHEAPKSYECFDCKKIVKNRFDLSRHIQQHSTNGRITFECDYPACTKCFWTERLFIKHKREHGAKIFDCEHCNESFERRYDLHSHVREMHADKLEQYKCDQCDQRYFPLMSALKQHIYLMHTKAKGDSHHLCTECGRTFVLETLLKNHLQTHSDEKLSCSQCPAKLKNKYSLRKHMAIHSSERNFICKKVIDGGQICGQKFRYAASLNQHRRRHGNISRPFQCQFGQNCSAKFFTNHKLQVHMRIHTGERPYKCDYCFRAFTQKGDMTKHMLIHLGPTPHKCDNCGESFRLGTELRKHSYTHFKPPEN